MHVSNCNEEGKEMVREERVVDKCGKERKDPAKDQERFVKKQRKRNKIMRDQRRMDYNQRESADPSSIVTEVESSALELKKQKDDGWKNADK